MSSFDPRPDTAQEQQLAQFVEDLRALGLEIGVDDTLRIGAIFEFSQGWSHGRRVRALKALLGRTEEARRRIEEISSLLFPDAPQDARDSGDSRIENRGYEANGRREPRAPLAVLGRHPERKADPGPTPHRHLLIAGLALVMFLGIWQKSDFWAPEELAPKPTANNPEGIESTTPTATPKATESQAQASDQQSEQTLLPMLTADDLAVDCDVKEPPAAPFWPFFLLFFLGSLIHGVVAWQLRRSQRYLARETASREGLRTSLGSRGYQVELVDRSTPLDEEPIREAAFALAAPAAQSLEERIDLPATIEATVRAAGRLDLRLSQEKAQGLILLLEDLRSPMERWPDHGNQLVQSLERQGGRVARRYFQGTPESLSESTNFSNPQRLEELLAELQPHLVIVLTDAGWFESAKEELRLGTLKPLVNALWIHPRPRELWDYGARWLASRARMVPIGEPDRLVPGAFQLGTAPPTRWFPLEAHERTTEAALRVAEFDLGKAFYWLAAGAQLARHNALTARAWWAIRAGFRRKGLLEFPIECAERVWEYRWIRIGSDGVVSIEPDFRDRLCDLLLRDRPDLASQVQDWLVGWITQDVKRLEAAGQNAEQPSLGWLLAKLALGKARFESSDRAQREAGLQSLESLARLGFDGWVNRIEPTMRERSVARYFSGLEPAPRWLGWVTAGVLLLQLTLLPYLISDKVRRQLFPLEPSIQFLTVHDPPLLSPNYPVRFCDRFQGSNDWQVTIGGKGTRVVEGRDSRGAVTWEVEVAESQLVDVFELGLRSEDPVVIDVLNAATGSLALRGGVKVALDDRLERFPLHFRVDNERLGSGLSDLELDYSQALKSLKAQDHPWLVVSGRLGEIKRVEKWTLADRSSIENAPYMGWTVPDDSRSLDLEVVILALGPPGDRGFGRASLDKNFPTAASQLLTARRWTYFQGRVMTWREQAGDRLHLGVLPEGLDAVVRPLYIPSSGQLSIVEYNRRGSVGTPDWAQRAELGLFFEGIPDQAGRKETSVGLDDSLGRRRTRVTLEVQDWERRAGETVIVATVGEPFVWSPRFSIARVSVPSWLVLNGSENEIFGTPNELGEWVVSRFWESRRIDGEGLPGSSSDALELRLNRYVIQARPPGCSGETMRYCGGECVDTKKDPLHWGDCFSIHPSLRREAVLASNLAVPSSQQLYGKSAYPPPFSVPSDLGSAYARLSYRWSADLNKAEAVILSDSGQEEGVAWSIPRLLASRRDGVPVVGEMAVVCTPSYSRVKFLVRARNLPSFVWRSGSKQWEQLPRGDWGSESELLDSSFELQNWARRALRQWPKCAIPI